MSESMIVFHKCPGIGSGLPRCPNKVLREDLLKINTSDLVAVHGESRNQAPKAWPWARSTPPPDAVREGESATLSWIRIDGDGGESRRRGVLWCHGPALRTGEIFWAVCGACYVPVLAVHRRHRSRGGRGRWMDPGEAYTDSCVAREAMAAPVVRDEGWGGAGRRTSLQRADGREAGEPAPPWRRWAGPGDTRIVVDPLPDSILQALSRPYE